MKKFDDVICRLYNCKFSSAFRYIKEIKGIPKKVIKEFEKADEELSNCGAGGTLISDRADYLAGLIGFEWKEDDDGSWEGYYYPKK